MVRFCGVRDRKSKVLQQLKVRFLINGHWKDFFVLSAPPDHKRCPHILTIVTKTIATGQNIDGKYFLSLADQQSVDQQAFKAVWSFSKLPVGNLLSESLKSTVRRSRCTAPISRPITWSNSNQVYDIIFSLFPNVDLKRSIFQDFLTFRRPEKSDSNGRFVIFAALLQADWCTAVPLSAAARQAWH